MNVPELLLKPDLGKRGYRLRCRFRVWPNPRAEYLAVEKVRVAERFVRDMHVRGWEYAPRYGFTMTGPYVPVQPMTVRRPRRLTAREMLPRVMQGDPFRATERETIAQTMGVLVEQNWWEYELAGVFVHRTILTELPDSHEERHA